MSRESSCLNDRHRTFPYRILNFAAVPPYQVYSTGGSCLAMRDEPEQSAPATEFETRNSETPSDSRVCPTVWISKYMILAQVVHREGRDHRPDWARVRPSVTAAGTRRSDQTLQYDPQVSPSLAFCFARLLGSSVRHGSVIAREIAL